MRTFRGATFGVESGLSSVCAVLLAVVVAGAAIVAPQARAQAADGSCLATLAGSSRLDQGAGGPPRSLTDGAGGAPVPFVYKDADRKSDQPIKVGSVRLDGAEADGDVLAMSVDDVRPNKPDSTAAYKVALHMPMRQVNRDILKNAFDDGVLKLSSSFSMKIDSAGSSFRACGHVIFHQFWQGTPFHPALTLAIVSDKDLREGDKGSIEAGARFELRIANDDHSPSRYFKTELIRHDLGPVKVDRWIRWEVRLVLDPTGRGSVEVLKDGGEVWRSAIVQVGFDRNNRQYKSDQRPNPMISSADLMIYRPNWAGRQLIRFKRFTVCAS